jgi:predicted DNA-binding transcriptional regulator YafY
MGGMRMKRTQSQFARFMELDRLIKEKQYPNCLTFSNKWGVSQKTTQRDIDFLRDQCGAPIAYDRDRKGFYYEDATWMLPSVFLSEGELLAVLLASRALEQYRGTPVAKQVSQVFDKLAGLLPDKVTLKPELLYSRFTFKGVSAKPVDADIWATVVNGLLSQRSIRLRYRTFEAGSADKNKESRVNPYHIANLQGEWYLLGVHSGHTDIRQFSMARIEKASLTADQFMMPADFDPEKLLSGTFGRYVGDGKTQTVRLLFPKDVASWVTEREWHPSQLIKTRRTGEIELSFPATGMFEVMRWVLSWGRNVKVLAPPELVRMVGDEIKEMSVS